MTNTDLEALLQLLTKHNVEEFKQGTLSLKFGPRPQSAPQLLPLDLDKPEQEASEKMTYEDILLASTSHSRKLNQESEQE